MIIVVLSLLKRRGLAMYPFVFIKEQSGLHDTVLMNHERIHLRQQLELMIFPFYLFYLLHYLFNLLLEFNHEKAYRNIVFEREAYAKQEDLGYLSKRTFWSFLKYFRGKTESQPPSK